MKNIKATLEFNLEDPEAKATYRRAINADKAYLALHEISQAIFRPARKHGYSDSKLNEVLDSNESVPEMVDLLEDKFYAILAEYGVDLDDIY